MSNNISFTGWNYSLFFLRSQTVVMSFHAVTRESNCSSVFLNEKKDLIMITCHTQMILSCLDQVESSFERIFIFHARISIHKDEMQLKNSASLNEKFFFCIKRWISFLTDEKIECIKKRRYKWVCKMGKRWKKNFWNSFLSVTKRH